ncbi:MAG: hypothetical protein J0L83_06650 [Chitinophagales bacterium]|jgi:hypothetical protein|nr:hypothetical protein [Chitinophagales bacterium]
MFSKVIKRLSALIIVLSITACEKNVNNPEEDLKKTLAGPAGSEWRLDAFYNNDVAQTLSPAQRAFRMKLSEDLSYEDSDGHFGNWRSHKSNPKDSLLIIFQNPLQGFVVTDYAIKKATSNTLELNYQYNTTTITLCYKK